jgi:hypothetical protein
MRSLRQSGGIGGPLVPMKVRELLLAIGVAKPSVASSAIQMTKQKANVRILFILMLPTNKIFIRNIGVKPTE